MSQDSDFRFYNYTPTTTPTTTKTTTAGNTTGKDPWGGWGAITQVLNLATAIFSDPGPATKVTVPLYGQGNNTPNPNNNYNGNYPGNYPGNNNQGASNTMTYAIYGGIALVVVVILFTVLNKK